MGGCSTGTAETNQGSGEDNSVFFAFAPKDDPKIAIAVYVENATWGGTYAAPIASLMIEKYLKGEVKRTWYENWVMQRDQPVVRSRTTVSDSTRRDSNAGAGSDTTNLIQE